MKRFECSLVRNNIVRVGVYKIEEVLPFIVDNKRSPNALRMYDGYEVKMWSLRYHTFKNSIKCAGCGIPGQYFALEKAIDGDGNRYHFNLYSKLETGEEVLMTKDHIYPKSLGGKDVIKNMQTMCKVCNEMKMDRVETKEVKESATWLMKFKQKLNANWHRFRRLQDSEIFQMPTKFVRLGWKILGGNAS